MPDYDEDGVRIMSEAEKEEYARKTANPTSPRPGCYNPGEHIMQMLANSFVYRPYGHNFPPFRHENGDE